MSIVLQGSTSGSVTLQEPAIAGSTVLNLPATSGTILTTNSPATGNVIQVVNFAISTQVSNATSTFVDTGLTATITPKFVTSKILIITTHNANLCTSPCQGIQWKLLRNGSQIQYVDDLSPFNSAGSANIAGSSCNLNYLDSPATTSATTYKTQFANRSASGTAYTNFNAAGTSYITLMEIAQ